MQAILALLTYLIEQILIPLLYYAFQLNLVIHFRLFLKYLGNSFKLALLDGLKYFI